MRKKKIIIIAIIGIILYAIFTGGLSVGNSKNFGGQRNVILVNDLRSDLWIKPSTTDWSIPFIGHYYGSKKPYGLRIQIWDESKTFTRIKVEEILVTYTDGETVKHNLNWVGKLEPYTKTNSSSSGIIKTEMHQISDTVENIVDRHENATITISGQLTKLDGTSKSFSTQNAFQAESDFEINTFWDVLTRI